MNLLIKSATITDPNSVHNQQTADILIENGIITAIASNIQTDAEIFDAKGQYVSPGFFDLNCNIGELGQETKEDLQTGTKAAAAGGLPAWRLCLTPIRRYIQNRKLNLY